MHNKSFTVNFFLYMFYIYTNSMTKFIERAEKLEVDVTVRTHFVYIHIIG